MTPQEKEEFKKHHFVIFGTGNATKKLLQLDLVCQDEGCQCIRSIYCSNKKYFDKVIELASTHGVIDENCGIDLDNCISESTFKHKAYMARMLRKDIDDVIFKKKKPSNTSDNK